MEGGEEAAGKPLSAGSEAWRKERGGSGKPLDAGSEGWRKERRQRVNRWTQGARHGGRREEAAGETLDAGGERRAGAVSQSWGWTATWLSMNK